MPGLTVKAYFKKCQLGGDYEIRRFAIEENVASSYTYLVGKIGVAFPELANKSLKLCWKDSDGDLVTFSSDEELMSALVAASTDGIFRVFVEVDDSKKEGEQQQQQQQQQWQWYKKPESEKDLHPGITCDGCQGPVKGIRYKCVVCSDYDLCESCKTAGLHTEHEMRAIEKPIPRDNPHFHHHHPGHAFFHHHPHFSPPPFTGATNMPPPPHFPGAPNMPPPHFHGASNMPPFTHHTAMFGFPFSPAGGFPGSEANKEARKAWKRWWKHGFGGEGCEGTKKCKKDKKRCKKEKDGECKDKSEERKQEKPMEEQTQQDKDTGSGSSSSSEDENIKNTKSTQSEYLKSVGQSVAAMLDPLGISVEVDVEHDGKRHHCHKRSGFKKGKCYREFGFPGGCGWIFQGPGAAGCGVQTSNSTSTSFTHTSTGNEATNTTNNPNGTHTTTTTFSSDGAGAAATTTTSTTTTKTSTITTTDDKAKEASAPSGEKKMESGTGTSGIPQEKTLDSDWTFVKGDDMVNESTVKMQELKIGQNDPIILSAIGHMQLMGFRDDGIGGNLYDLLSRVNGDISKAIDEINNNKNKANEKKN